MRNHHTAAVLLAAGITLAGCSSSSHDNKAAATTTPTATISSTTSAATTKLSTVWVPKLEALSNGPGIGACSSDSGSDDCVSAIGDATSLYGDIAAAISAVNAQAQYPKTIAEVTNLVDAADTYDKDECAGDPNADVDGSPCTKNADAITVGATTLQFVMKTDEANAGVL